VPSSALLSAAADCEHGNNQSAGDQNGDMSDRSALAWHADRAEEELL